MDDGDSCTQFYFKEGYTQENFGCISCQGWYHIEVNNFSRLTDLKNIFIEFFLYLFQVSLTILLSIMCIGPFPNTYRKTVRF